MQDPERRDRVGPDIGAHTCDEGRCNPCARRIIERRLTGDEAIEQREALVIQRGQHDGTIVGWCGGGRARSRVPQQPFTHHDRARHQIAKPLIALVGDDAHHPDEVAERHEVDEPDQIARRAGADVNTTAAVPYHAQSEESLARRLSIPDRFERDEVAPENQKLSEDQHRAGPAAVPRVAECRQESRHGCDGVPEGTREHEHEEQIDERRRTARPDAGQRVRHDHLLRCFDVERRVENGASAIGGGHRRIVMRRAAEAETTRGTDGMRRRPASRHSTTVDRPANYFFFATFLPAFLVTFLAAFFALVAVTLPFTKPFRLAPALNFGALLAAIFTFSPVCGLRPTRALRLPTLNVPKPVMPTFSPFFSALAITPSVASNSSFSTALACFFDRPTLSTSAFTIAILLMAPFSQITVDT